MNYAALLRSIVTVHGQAQAGAAGAVNRALLLRNWLIGAHLVEYEQGGAGRAAYGHRLLARLAADLQRKSVPGTSPDMLERMRRFYMEYPQLAGAIREAGANSASPMRNSRALAITASAVRKTDALGRKPASAAPDAKRGLPRPLGSDDVLCLSWTHWIELLRVDDPWMRAFYENECLRGQWSVRQLQRQIGSLLYERTGLSTDKRAMIARARLQASGKCAKVDELIRDPYVLEFTGLAERPRYRENDLERSLLDHLQAFLLELGTGFCFEARQKRITVGNEHDWIDLVFYHRHLRCHLLVDLKVRPFRHGDVGQMNFYLNWWKANALGTGDRAPVGLLLCTGADRVKVEYASTGIDHRLFVSRYRVALPKPAELERLITHDRAEWEQRRRRETGGARP